MPPAARAAFGRGAPRPASWSILLILSLLLVNHAYSAPMQYLPDLPGYIPVYIRLGDQPLEEINPVLAEAFHEPVGSIKSYREAKVDEPKSSEEPAITTTAAAATSTSTSTSTTTEAVPSTEEAAKKESAELESLESKESSSETPAQLAVTLPNTTSAPTKEPETFIMKIPRKTRRETREQKLD